MQKMLELIDVDYDLHDAVTDPKAAAQTGAPLVHEDAPNNIAFDWQLGNPKEEVAAALASAAHVTELDFVNQRMIPNAMEPRSAIGHYDTAYDKYTLYTSTQNPHLTRLLMCAFVLVCQNIKFEWLDQMLEEVLEVKFSITPKRL